MQAPVTVYESRLKRNFVIVVPTVVVEVSQRERERERTQPNELRGAHILLVAYSESADIRSTLRFVPRCSFSHLARFLRLRDLRRLWFASISHSAPLTPDPLGGETDFLLLFFPPVVLEREWEEVVESEEERVWP